MHVYSTMLKWEKEKETNSSGYVYLELEYLQLISLSFPGLCVSFKVKMLRAALTHSFNLLLFFIWNAKLSIERIKQNLGLEFSFTPTKLSLYNWGQFFSIWGKWHLSKCHPVPVFPSAIYANRIPKVGKNHASLATPVACLPARLTSDILAENF